MRSLRLRRLSGAMRSLTEKITYEGVHKVERSSSSIGLWEIPLDYCGSMVAGGLLEITYVTQVTPGTSLVILLLILSSTL